ncbi:MAG: cation diffusion facilitator family transporter [Candidatus Margulisbacteria bacterium]|nr:cation diffusion facilitator family transporter [Candidatus Margulisiibacteriota bacterium]
MDNKKTLLIALLIIVIVFCVELAGGFVSNSLALLSDAGHMLTDTMALALALTATIFAARPASKQKTFGFYRLEILSALFNGVLLTLISLYIFYQAYERFLQPSVVQSSIMLVVAVIGLLANVAAALILSKGSGDNLNVRGAFLHVISDLASSVGVIIGGLLIYLFGWNLVDPILGIMIGLLILRGALLLVFDSVNILLEAAPKGINTLEVAKTVMRVPGVKDLHDLHIWTISSGINAISAHVIIKDDAAERAAAILKEICALMDEKYRIKHCTFQTECDSCPEGLICHIEPGEKDEHEHHHGNN